jgi:hypothetical protein
MNCSGYFVSYNRRGLPPSVKLKGLRNKGWWPISIYYCSIRLESLRKTHTQKNSVNIASVQSENQTGNCQNTGQNCLYFNQLLRSLCVGLHIVARMRRLYETGTGLTTGFIGSHTVTLNYSVYTLHSQFTIVPAESSYCVARLPTP